MTLYVSLERGRSGPLRAAREVYRSFVQHSGISMSQPNGWAQFLFLAHRSPEGREAFHAYRLQRELVAGRAGEAQSAGPPA